VSADPMHSMMLLHPPPRPLTRISGNVWSSETALSGGWQIRKNQISGKCFLFSAMPCWPALSTQQALRAGDEAPVFFIRNSSERITCERIPAHRCMYGSNT
jgi:hypothetical protein